jgi:ATP-dependent RNA helicase DeaD
MTHNDFTAFGLADTLVDALTQMGFTTPTPIQAQAIPFALQDRDVLGTASTGTGKTAAFAVPLVAHLLKNPRSMALVMTPTRELAVQVMSVIEPLLVHHRDITTACLIGGEAIGRQLNQLQRKPRVIVGTPGRINDHLARRSLRLERADFLVLDETDRMLDMGFGVQIEKIIEVMADKRQTLMFSATLPQQILKMAARYLNEPERITIGTTNRPAQNIKQEQVMLADAEKYGALCAQLDGREGSIIVFVKTKYGADRMATKLDRAGYAADAIHGDLQQRRRDRVIAAFRDQQFRVLVATDVAARGLDIPHIEHVINYDLPQCPEDYIHRIGRTARAGAEGCAVNFVTPSDRAKWQAIVQLIDPEAARAARGQPNGPKKPPRRYRGDPGDANARRSQPKKWYGRKKAA